ncbi:FAD-dependent monooxygenase [Halomonas organivorans]
MKVAILGAGVAGISSAIALKMNGFDVSVYERHESASNIGAGIVVWPNAAYVLDKLGVLSEIESASGYPTKMQRLSSKGENLGAIDIESINHRMGYSSLSILRVDFQNILISKLESLGVSVQYGHAVTDIGTTESNKAVVYFQNGTNISVDIFVGADGRMASYSRQYVAGDNAPVYQGFINWVGVFESEEETFQEISVADYWGVGERFGIVPVSRNKAYWAGGVACTDIGPRNPADYKGELRSIFSDWPKAVRLMVERTPIAQINKIYVHDQDPTPIWYKNNLIMIGDAAHAPLPTSGQGACQALEDAWHLTNCLVESQSNLQQAFEKFTVLRFEKTANIISAARGFASSIFNRDDNFCEVRNENSKKADFAASATAMAKLWGQHLPIGA